MVFIKSVVFEYQGTVIPEIHPLDQGPIACARHAGWIGERENQRACYRLSDEAQLQEGSFVKNGDRFLRSTREPSNP